MSGVEIRQGSLRRSEGWQDSFKHIYIGLAGVLCDIQNKAIKLFFFFFFSCKRLYRKKPKYMYLNEGSKTHRLLVILVQRKEISIKHHKTAKSTASGSDYSCSAVF